MVTLDTSCPDFQIAVYSIQSKNSLLYKPPSCSPGSSLSYKYINKMQNYHQNILHAGKEISSEDMAITLLGHVIADTIRIYVGNAPHCKAPK